MNEVLLFVITIILVFVDLVNSVPGCKYTSSNGITSIDCSNIQGDIEISGNVLQVGSNVESDLKVNVEISQVKSNEESVKVREFPIDIITSLPV